MPRGRNTGKTLVRALGDLLVRQSDQFLAAGAHLDGNVAQGTAVETQARNLPVIRAAQAAELAGGFFLELLKAVIDDRGHKSILAQK
jgi:hypothetical protein